MKLEHVAIWTDNLEQLKDFYTKYFDGFPSTKYTNETNQFCSYFLTFKSGARLEIMTMPGIPDNANNTITAQHKGLIHLAFGIESKAEVDEMAGKLAIDGYKILDGPHKTGDGYYEFTTLDPDNNRVEVTTENTGY
jgi:lactoylglutathione lyase